MPDATATSETAANASPPSSGISTHTHNKRHQSPSTGPQPRPAPMAPSKRPKTLLDILPAEIRCRIYELALIEDAPINTSDAILAASRHNDSKRRAQRYGKKVPPPPNDAVNSTFPRLQPALLATCRQFRYEAYCIYYAENVSHNHTRTQRAWETDIPCYRPSPSR